MKPTLLVPLAGVAKRFKDKGIHLPKPLIVVNDRQMIDHALEPFRLDEYNVVFILRREHVNEFALDRIMRQKFGQVSIVVAEQTTEGTVCSCLLAEQHIAPEAPLVIYTPDVTFSPSFSINDLAKGDDGLLLTFKANNPAHSYVELGPDGYAKRTVEKSVISSDALVGVYVFRRGADFISGAQRMIEQRIKTNNEYYIAPLYNFLIEEGRKIAFKEVDKMHVLGTPEDVAFYVRNVCPRFGCKPIALAADHSGFQCKERVKRCLHWHGIQFIDFGSYAEVDCDYAEYVRTAAEHIRLGICDFGIAACRSGQGANMVANKIKGIRSALVFDEYTAEFSIRHNCANFFCLPSRDMVDVSLDRIIGILKSVTFDGGRHAGRVQSIEPAT